jgi:hypothetical protein
VINNETFEQAQAALDTARLEFSRALRQRARALAHDAGDKAMEAFDTPSRSMTHDEMLRWVKHMVSCTYLTGFNFGMEKS